MITEEGEKAIARLLAAFEREHGEPALYVCEWPVAGGGHELVAYDCYPDGMPKGSPQPIGPALCWAVADLIRPEAALDELIELVRKTARDGEMP